MAASNTSGACNSGEKDSPQVQGVGRGSYTGLGGGSLRDLHRRPGGVVEEEEAFFGRTTVQATIYQIMHGAKSAKTGGMGPCTVQVGRKFTPGLERAAGWDGQEPGRGFSTLFHWTHDPILRAAGAWADHLETWTALFQSSIADDDRYQSSSNCPKVGFAMGTAHTALWMGRPGAVVRPTGWVRLSVAQTIQLFFSEEPLLMRTRGRTKMVWLSSWGPGSASTISCRNKC